MARRFHPSSYGTGSEKRKLQKRSYTTSQKKYQDKTIMIFDQVGKQVRWLQYYLKANGYNEFIFLKGGATGVLKEQGYSS